MNNCRQNKNCRTENMVTDTTQTDVVSVTILKRVIIIL
jgi:hypothetical protein